MKLILGIALLLLLASPSAGQAENILGSIGDLVRLPYDTAVKTVDTVLAATNDAPTATAETDATTTTATATTAKPQLFGLGAGGILASIGSLVTLPLTTAAKTVDSVQKAVKEEKENKEEKEEKENKEEKEEKDKPEVQSDAVSVEGEKGMLTCPQGWMGYGSSCYYFERETTANWSAAETQCEKKDAHLWVPNDLKEFEAIRIHCQSTPYMTWLGGVGTQHKGSVEYKWSAEQKVADVDALPWMLQFVKNHAITSLNTCLGYNHCQRGHVKIGTLPTLPCKGVMWADCKLAIGRFAVCEREI